MSGTMRAACWTVAVLAGCGQSVSVQSEVRGSVGGIVLAAAPGLPPLDRATVTVVAGGEVFSAFTGSDGVFTIEKVPVGSVIVKIAADGHFDVYLNRTLAAAAGNFPASNAALTVGPIAMVSNQGSLKVRVVDQNGAPTPNIKVVARAEAAFLDLGGAGPGGIVDASGTSRAMDGLAIISGLPDFSEVGALISDKLTVSVAPTEVSGGDAYQFLGIELQFAGRQLGADNATLTPTIVLAGPRTALSVLASNIDWLEKGGTNGPTGSVIPATGPLTIAFNQALNPASVRVDLFNEAGEPVMAMPTPTVVGGNIVSIGLGARGLDAGARYNVALRVASLADHSKEYRSGLVPFFTAPPMGAPVSVTPASMSEMVDGTTTDYVIHFSEPIGLGGGSRDRIPCVVYYDTDLDGDDKRLSSAEWNQGGAGLLKCDPGIDKVGHFLRPDEPAFARVSESSVITGFTTRWRLTTGNLPKICTNFDCTKAPVSLYLVFSRNTESIVRRANGSPVPDLAAIQISRGIGNSPP